MRFADLLFAFPSFVLALFLMVVLGFGVTNVILAIALVYVPIFARLTRNLALTVREESLRPGRAADGPVDAAHPGPRDPAQHHGADHGAG